MSLSKSQLRELLTKYRQENWQGIQTPEWQQRIVEDYLVEESDGFFGQLFPYYQPRSGDLILDVGSGVGSFVVACCKRGLLAFGIEPDRIGIGSDLTAVGIARRRVDASVFVAGTGEQLPFKAGGFDLVTLHQVLEHVADPERVLRECLRVVKNQGIVYFGSPNYLRFWEPHYKVFWLPLLPKPLGKLYLHLRGRDPGMLDQLNYTTHYMLRSVLRNLGVECDAVDLHGEHFRQKCLNEEGFVSLRGRLVKWLTQLPRVGSWVLQAALMLYRLWDPGIEFVIVKRQNLRLKENNSHCDSDLSSAVSIRETDSATKISL